jgi:UDP:flavonoid glycosyltransferase YjiC (YdhE family)
VRFLFTFAGGSGHFEPLLPLAHAAVAAGHLVAFAARPWMVPKVEALGLAAFPAGSDTGLTPVRRPLLPLDNEREERDFREGFARRNARERLADLLPLCTDWRPDLIVWEDTDFGAAVAAERLGLPHASVNVLISGSFARPEVVTEPLHELRAENGLPPDPDLVMLNRYLVLSPLPARFRDPAFPLPATARTFRSFTVEPLEANAVPPWGANPGGAPTVYFTLGTIYNMESGDLFQRVLAGLRDLPIHLIVTVGRDFDPAELGPQPANVHIERYIPQARVLPHCRMVVSHGGSGSVTGALAHGLPMVLIPMGADQPYNAARCAALGVAQVLDPVAATPEMVREAASAVLSKPGYRQAAERLRDEIAALPDPAEAVALLEQLAAERRP